MTTWKGSACPGRHLAWCAAGPVSSLRAGDGIAPAGILAALGSLVGLGEEGQAADDAIEAAAHLIPGAGGIYDALSPIGQVITDQIYAAQ